MSASPGPPDAELVHDPFVQSLLATLPRYLGEVPKPELRAILVRLARQHVASGGRLYRQGEAGDCMHFVVTGRLQVRERDHHGGARIVTHLSSGDCVGEFSLITGEPRVADVFAVRDTLLARLGREDFDALVRSHPEAGLAIARHALRRVTVDAADPVPGLRNIAIVPLHSGLPTARFGRRLELALLRFGNTLFLDSEIVRHRLGLSDIGRCAELDVDRLALERFLDHAENTRRFVVYQADERPNAWTRACIAHADHVLLLANRASPPEITPIESALFGEGPADSLAGRELVLLHEGRHSSPSGTAAWLAPRILARHSHVSWDGPRDFNRLARLLAGRAVTLVLSGGGARGLSHIGAIRAIREAGVPVDAVGGSSIGAVVGALVALDWSDERILQACKRAFVDDRPLDDYTVPLFALLSGKKLARTLRHHIGEVDIADLWQPYFCVSSNLSKSRVEVHRSGPLLQALQASVSLPGLLPPVVTGGDLHVDGGVLDNLPVPVMKRLVGGNTIAIGVSVPTEFPVKVDAFPSPLQYLRARLAGGAPGASLPKLPSLLIKSTTLGGLAGRAHLQQGNDLDLNPPMREFGFLDWKAIYEIVDVGYRYTCERLPAWIERNPGVRWRDELLDYRVSGAIG